MKHIPWRDFLALITSIGAVGLALGATIPLAALTLEQRGAGADAIGVVTASAAAGLLAMTPFVTRWTARVGPAAAMRSAVWVAALSTALLQWTDSVPLWCALRCVFGAAMGVLFTVGEAWVNRIAPDHMRGRVIAIYTTNFTLFQMGGPALVAALHGKLPYPFLACAALLLLALPALALLPSTVVSSHAQAHPPWQTVLPRMPMIIMGTAFFALFDTVVLSFLPVYAMRQGIAAESALLSASIVLAGDTALQFAIGWLADRLGRQRVHAGCGVAVCLLLPLLPWAAAHASSVPWLWWALLVTLGGTAGSIYTLSLVACGERFRGGALVTASAIVNAAWGVASAGGPLATGALMEIAGIQALPAVLLAGAGLFLWSAWRDRGRDGESETTAEVKAG